VLILILMPYSTTCADLEKNSNLADQLLLHQSYLDEDKEQENWKIVEYDDGTKLILHPLACDIHYQTLNPNIYRRIAPITDLDHFAQLIGTPSNWKDVCRIVVPAVSEIFQIFQNQADHANQPTIQANFFHLAVITAYLICENHYMSSFNPNKEELAIVRGILAREEYAVQAKLGVVLENLQGSAILASLVKTERQFPDDEFYYRDTRGVQLFTTIYAKFCPTLLVTPKKFKLFVENSERTQIYTFPSKWEIEEGEEEMLSEFVHSTAVSEMNEDLIKIIVISCMAPERQRAKISSDSRSELKSK
jgi:hypothetical protein